MIKVLVVEDHTFVREGIVKALKAEPGIQVIGEASGEAEMLAALEGKTQPDVLMLDLKMPDFNFMKVIPQLRVRYPGIKILVVTAWDDATHIRLMMNIGVEGYLIKGENQKTLVEAVYEVGSGRTYYSQKVMGAALSPVQEPALSQRELQVLALVARDTTTDQIAQELKLSARTVETYVKRAGQKLGVSSRSAAVAKAVQLGYIVVPD